LKIFISSKILDDVNAEAIEAALAQAGVVEAGAREQHPEAAGAVADRGISTHIIAENSNLSLIVEG